MMRLVEVNKRDRYPFIAVFKGYTTTGGQRGIAIHINFENVKNEYGQLVAKYVTFAYNKTFSSLYLQPGDVVLFWARIRDFTKVLPNYRYSGTCEMYSRLLNPTKARKLYSPVKRIEYNNFNENNSIDYNNFLYDLKAMPTLYLLDRNRKVVLKDASYSIIRKYIINNLM